MLSDDAKMVIEFIDECRGTLMIKDDLHIKMESMYDILHKAEEAFEILPEGKSLYIELEDLVVKTLNAAKEIYFEYGENYGGVRDNRFWRKTKEAM